MMVPTNSCPSRDSAAATPRRRRRHTGRSGCGALFLCIVFRGAGDIRRMRAAQRVDIFGDAATTTNPHRGQRARDNVALIGRIGVRLPPTAVVVQVVKSGSAIAFRAVATTSTISCSNPFTSSKLPSASAPCACFACSAMDWTPSTPSSSSLHLLRVVVGAESANPIHSPEPSPRPRVWSFKTGCSSRTQQGRVLHRIGDARPVIGRGRGEFAKRGIHRLPFHLTVLVVVRYGVCLMPNRTAYTARVAERRIRRDSDVPRQSQRG